MADEAKAAGPTAPSEPDGGELEFEDWSYRLLNLERITADPEDDDGEDIFTAAVRAATAAQRKISGRSMVVASGWCADRGCGLG